MRDLQLFFFRGSIPLLFSSLPLPSAYMYNSSLRHVWFDFLVY